MGSRGQDNRPTILIVDDTPTNLDVLREVLSADYRIKIALNGVTALAIAAALPQPDLILLDVMMPEMDGLEVCRALKADPITQGIPVVFVTALTEEADEERGLALGAVDYVTKPIRPAIVRARVKTHLFVHDQNLELEAKVRERTSELTQTRLEIIRRLGRAAEFRDNETGLHILRMSHYARLIAQLYAGRDAWADAVFHAAPMHDVGKIAIPDGILLKPGPLTDQEWLVMRTHPQLGAEIIGDGEFDLMAMSRDIALCHHERCDGTGYPRQLTSDEIPLAARIVTVADVYDALTTERPYKIAWSSDDALAYLCTHAGRYFDARAVECLRQRMDEVLAIKEKYAEHPEPFTRRNK